VKAAEEAVETHRLPREPRRGCSISHIREGARGKGLGGGRRSVRAEPPDQEENMTGKMGEDKEKAANHYEG